MWWTIWLLVGASAQAETDPVVQILGPCARTAAGRVGCFGDAGGGVALEPLTDGADHLAKRNDRVCARRPGKDWVCARSTSSEDALPTADTVDLAGPLQLQSTGAVVHAWEGTVGQVATDVRLHAATCADGTDAWVVLDPQGKVHADPRCTWTPALDWSRVAALSGSDALVCGRFEDGRVRCSRAAPDTASALFETATDGWIPAPPAASLSATHSELCVHTEAGGVWCTAAAAREATGAEAAGLLDGVSGVTSLQLTEHGGLNQVCVGASTVRCSAMGASTTFYHSAVKVPGVTKATDVAAFSDGICALGSGGLTCWGHNLQRVGRQSGLPETVPNTQGLRALEAADSLYWIDKRGDLYRDGSLAQAGAATDGAVLLRAGHLSDPRMMSRSDANNGEAVCVLQDHTATCWLTHEDGTTLRLDPPSGKVVDVLVRDSLCAVYADGQATCLDPNWALWVPSSEWMTWQDSVLVPAPQASFTAASLDSCALRTADEAVRVSWFAADGQRGSLTDTSTVAVEGRALPPHVRTWGSSVWWIAQDDALWVDGIAVATDVAWAGPLSGAGMVVRFQDGQVGVLPAAPYDGLTGTWGAAGQWTEVEWVDANVGLKQSAPRKKSRRQR